MSPSLGPPTLFMVSPAPAGIFTPHPALTPSSSSGAPACSPLLLPAELIADFSYSLRPVSVPGLSRGPCGDGSYRVSLLPRPALSLSRPVATRMCFQRPPGLPEWPPAWLRAFGHVILFVLAAVLGAHCPCLWVVEDFVNTSSRLEESPWLQCGRPPAAPSAHWRRYSRCRAQWAERDCTGPVCRGPWRVLFTCPRPCGAPAPPVPLWAHWLTLAPRSSRGKEEEVATSCPAGCPAQASGWPLTDA